MLHNGMLTNIFAAAAALSDDALLRRVTLLAGREREACVELVAHLAELDTRRIYLAQGYGSLFSYCTGALRLSEHAAYNRIEAARAARRFPVILDLLADGSVNLTTVRLLAPHLTPENHRDVLAEACGLGKREIELLVARLSPRPDVGASIRRLPTPVPSEPAPKPVAALPSPSPAAVPPARPPVVAPLTPERYRVQFTVDSETHQKLRRAQDLLRREIPNGDPAAIFGRALTLLLEDVARKKLAATSSPRRTCGTSDSSRHVPAEVKRTVWRRDQGQCAFVAASGRRCTEHAFLEFHHVEPFALGGPTTTDNVSLRCRRHNAHEGELVFGPYLPSVAREVPPVHAASAGRTRSGTSWSARPGRGLSP